MIQSINPMTGAVIATYDPHTADQVDEALTSAVLPQTKWRKLPVGERCKLLSAMSDELWRGKEKFARLITEEMGKPITESVAEIEKCALTCDFYSKAAPRFLADEPIEADASYSGVVFDPLGVVLAIMPWNYPFWQFFRFAAPALAAGNGAILKHASNVPGCAIEIEALMLRAGCPDGLMHNLLIEARDVAAIIADDRIAAVTMTGSTQVGQTVASQAGAALKKQVLELGGSDPFIVLGDANLEAAAETAVKARFINTGQSCVNAKRFIVEESVADRFTELFREGVSRLKVGDPFDPETQIGPMARLNLRDELHDQVERSVAGGAEAVVGGGPLDREGCFYAPTVLDKVTPQHAAFREELFGPVASIIRARHADHAVALANDSAFGLGAALWTSDLERSRDLSRAIDAGAVFINGMVASDARLPFGGIKKSGYGRELGSYGIREFTNVKTIWIGPKTTSGGDMDAVILKPDELPANDRGNGARTTPLVTRKCGSTGLINGITEFNPGAKIGLHYHNCEESVMVLKGEAVAEIDGDRFLLKAGDTTWIPAGVPHRFLNEGNGVMRIFWTYADINATRTMVETGVEQSIDEEHAKAKRL